MARQKKTLGTEAKEFVEKKKPAGTNKTLTLRRYYAGMALAGFLGAGNTADSREIVRQAYSYADLMIEND